MFEDRPPLDKTFRVMANSRLTVNVQEHFPTAASRRFGALIAGAGEPLVVEGAVYGNAEGVFWASGSNLLATPWP